MSRVSISRKTALALLDCKAINEWQPSVLRAFAELESATKPKPKKSLPFKSRKQVKATKKRSKKELRQEVRAAIMARADGRCESCGCEADVLHWDHMFGRVRVPETERSGWALCVPCDNRKTLNHPSSAAWLERFITHAERAGFSEEAGMATRLLGKNQIKAELSRGAPNV